MPLAVNPSVVPIALILIVAVGVAGLFVANGALLIFRPNYFYGFMIGKIHGNWWDKTAEHSPEYKGLGVVLPLSGLLFLGVFLRFLFMAVAGNP